MRDRAAYMREYRKRQRERPDEAVQRNLDANIAATINAIGVRAMQERVGELEEEVRRLKRELAVRPDPAGFNTRPFTPVPKK